MMSARISSLPGASKTVSAMSSASVKAATNARSVNDASVAARLEAAGLGVGRAARELVFEKGAGAVSGQPRARSQRLVGRQEAISGDGFSQGAVESLLGERHAVGGQRMGLRVGSELADAVPGVREMRSAIKLPGGLRECRVERRRRLPLDARSQPGQDPA